jgi:hypothetical protein
LGDKIKANEMCGDCSTHGERREGFSWGNLRKRNDLEDVDVVGRIIEVGCGHEVD